MIRRALLKETVTMKIARLSACSSRSQHPRLQAMRSYVRMERARDAAAPESWGTVHLGWNGLALAKWGGGSPVDDSCGRNVAVSLRSLSQTRECRYA
jgi:hypothetical protein